MKSRPRYFWRMPSADSSERFAIHEPIERARAYCADLAATLGEPVELLAEDGTLLERFGARRKRAG